MGTGQNSRSGGATGESQTIRERTIEGYRKLREDLLIYYPSLTPFTVGHLYATDAMIMHTKIEDIALEQEMPFANTVAMLFNSKGGKNPKKGKALAEAHKWKAREFLSSRALKAYKDVEIVHASSIYIPSSAFIIMKEWNEGNVPSWVFNLLKPEQLEAAAGLHSAKLPKSTHARP